MTIELKKIVLLALVLVLLSTAAFIRFIGPVEAGGTIYIRADGSVDPDTAPISTVDNVTYTFLGNIIYDEIVVEKNNTVVDGAGYSIQGAWDLHRGISLHGGSNVTIKNIEIREFEYGIHLQHSSNNTISGNNITENAWGINLVYSSDNTINGNNITNNDTGILVHLSSFDNTIYHNNFIGNTQQVQIPTSGQANFWDDGAGKGNYWSDYEERYPNATEIDGSGIWGTPYVIDENNQDNYPIVPEFPTWTSILFILIVLTVAIAIYTRAIHRGRLQEMAEERGERQFSSGAPTSRAA